MNANKLANFIKDNESLLLNLHVKYNCLMADNIILAELQNVEDQTLTLGNISSCIPGIYRNRNHYIVEQFGNLFYAYIEVDSACIKTIIPLLQKYDCKFNTSYSYNCRFNPSYSCNYYAIEFKIPRTVAFQTINLLGNRLFSLNGNILYKNGDIYWTIENDGFTQCLDSGQAIPFKSVKCKPGISKLELHKFYITVSGNSIILPLNMEIAMFSLLYDRITLIPPTAKIGDVYEIVEFIDK